MKIILSGGGTLGPVVPLLGILEAYQTHNPRDSEFIWVGTKKGPERKLMEERQIKFYAIGAGKWRRYFSFWNLLDLFKIILAFFQSIVLLLHEKPQLLISAGGFASVPLHWAAAVLGISAWVHQQDLRPGLANRLMLPFAKKITTALKESAAQLPKRKTEWLGNPARDLTVASVPLAREKLKLPSDNCPVVFAFGGGTGSASINKIIVESLSELPADWHVIHLLGRERPRELALATAGVYKNYHVYEFFTDEMKSAYAAASVVVARAGFATLTELAMLKKAAIILPMFGTHQEDNARYFAGKGGIVMLPKKVENGLYLARELKILMNSPERQRELGERLHQLLPRANPKRVVEIIEWLTKK